MQFQPDAFILVGINDIHWAAKELVHILESRDTKFRGPARLPSRTMRGSNPGLDELTASSRLRPYREDLLRWLYRTTGWSTCREQGILPIAVFIPQPRDEAPQTLELIPSPVVIAREEGFAIIDLLDTYNQTS